MIIGPAVGVGGVVILFLIFGLGYFLTEGVVNKFGKKRKGAPLVYRDNLEEVKFHSDWTKQEIDNAAKAGGIFAVILVVILVANAPSGWLANSWPWLTLIGFIVGLLSFALRAS